jgi:photosystem II stability/assembly factor-like uncharacterized protein
VEGPARAAIVALALLASAFLPSVTTVPAAQAAQTLPAPPSGSGAPAVLALPGGVVWDYDGSQILRSTDGGAKWRAMLPTWPLTQTSLQVSGAFFLNGEDAWAETEHEWPAQPGVTTTWQTTDGGASWRQGLSLPGGLFYGTPGFDEFAFSDAEHGFGFGVEAPVTTGFEQQRQGYLWATANGGRDWRRVPAAGLPWQASAFSSASATGCSVPDPFDITAVSESVVLLAEAGCPATAPGLWRSDDGGRDWRPVLLPAPPGGWAVAERWRYPGVARSGAEVMGVRFFPHGQGVAAVAVRPGEVLVYRTSDDAASWSLASALGTGSLARPAGFWASTSVVWEMPAPAGLYVTTNAGQRWALRRSGLSLPGMAETSFASPASGVGFSSGLDLGLASSGDTGMRTSDGGHSWAAVQFSAPAFLGNVNTEVPFSTVTFATPRVGWVGGMDGIEATTDGGKTWTAQMATAEPVEQFSFAGPEDGWALTPDQLFATSDGGAHWSAQPESRLGAFSNVQLVRPGFGVGVICGQSGGTRALATYNGGRSWGLLPLPDPNELDCGSVPPSPGTMTGVCFGTAQTGWAVWRRPGASAIVKRTDDGGLRWSEVATVNTSPGPLACLGRSDVWLGLNWMENMATVGGVAASTDGGRTWRTSVHPAPHNPFSVPSLTPTAGTPVGQLGAVQSPVGVLTQPVAALAVPGPGTAVDLWEDYGPACASGFGLAFTSDGGNHWTGAPGGGPNSRCGTIAPPHLSAVPLLPPSFSFPDPDHGFVLGPVAGTPAVPKGVTEPVTTALIATTDGGSSWQLLARFPWRVPAATVPR